VQKKCIRMTTGHSMTRDEVATENDRGVTLKYEELAFELALTGLLDENAVFVQCGAGYECVDSVIWYPRPRRPPPGTVSCQNWCSQRHWAKPECPGFTRPDAEFMSMDPEEALDTGLTPLEMTHRPLIFATGGRSWEELSARPWEFVAVGEDVGVVSNDPSKWEGMFPLVGHPAASRCLGQLGCIVQMRLGEDPRQIVRLRARTAFKAGDWYDILDIMSSAPTEMVHVLTTRAMNYSNRNCRSHAELVCCLPSGRLIGKEAGDLLAVAIRPEGIGLMRGLSIEGRCQKSFEMIFKSLGLFDSQMQMAVEQAGGGAASGLTIKQKLLLDISIGACSYTFWSSEDLEQLPQLEVVQWVRASMTQPPEVQE
jgi:hypothetical protein